MPAAREVHPLKWTPRPGDVELTVLFDNGEYSLISGLFDGGPAIGERWNGQGGIGFPSQGGNPTWHVVPDFLEVPILHGLLDEVTRRSGQPAERATAILHELAIRHQTMQNANVVANA
jgi:hypothetical protein